MISASAHPDDQVIDVEFDATPWFEQADVDEILELAEEGWGCGPAADEVALYMADHDADLAKMFGYIDLRRRTETCGFECYVDEDEAREWLAANRPALALPEPHPDQEPGEMNGEEAVA